MSVPDVTGLRVEAETVVAAPAGLVWDLVADVTNVGRWSPECVHADWADARDRRCEPGAVFTGRNRSGGFEWTMTCVVTAAVRPRLFAWDVLDGDDPAGSALSSSWRYDLSAVPGGTLVRNCFEHGPGRSGLRWMMGRNEDQAGEIAARRRAELAGNMARTLAAMKTAAEAAAGSAPGS